MNSTESEVTGKIPGIEIATILLTKARPGYVKGEGHVELCLLIIVISVSNVKRILDLNYCRLHNV